MQSVNVGYFDTVSCHSPSLLVLHWRQADLMARTSALALPRRIGLVDLKPKHVFSNAVSGVLMSDGKMGLYLLRDVEDTLDQRLSLHTTRHVPCMSVRRYLLTPPHPCRQGPPCTSAPRKFFNLLSTRARTEESFNDHQAATLQPGKR